MNDDPVTQTLAELQDLVRCRCHPAYTGRNLRDPDCNCDDAEAVEIVADRIKAQAAEIERLRGDLAKALEALGEIATDEHPLGWIAITALAALTGAQKDGN